jgi:D-alanyl-lipoteichoic acid acyltransferase DltB (MBOAT superfamily)
MLLCASYFFYCSWQPDLLYLILFTTAVSYASGLIIDKSKNSTVRRVSLIVALVCSLSVLLFFKYFNFLADTAIGFINLFGAGLPDFSLNLILPVGI